MTDILRTSRLRLRVLDSRDAAFYLELVNDPAFIAHIGDRGLRTLEAARKAIEEGPVAKQGARGTLRSVYCRDPDGSLIEISSYEDVK